jgi:hypothetical protein
MRKQILITILLALSAGGGRMICRGDEPLDAKRAPPPLYMPAWGAVIKEAELDDLVLNCID